MLVKLGLVRLLEEIMRLGRYTSALGLSFEIRLGHLDQIRREIDAKTAPQCAK
jgi:hypothetical protein